MRGVVLLDLPDHDSTEVSHHLEVDRLVQLADLMIWVLDPQKYADAAVHDRYLAPLATHRDVMLVMLNHVDTVPPDRLESMLADVRRLLDADGLHRRARHRDQCQDRRGHGPAAPGDRLAGGGQEGRPPAPRGRPARRRPADGRGDRLGADAEAVEGARRRARGRARRLGRRTDRGRRPSTTPRGCAPTAPPAGRSSRGSRGCGPTRSSGSTSTSAPRARSCHGPRAAPRCPSRPTSSAPASTPPCARWPTTCAGDLSRPWAHAVREASLSRHDDLDDRLDRGPRRHRPGRVADPGVGRAGPGAPVAAPARGDRRRGVAGRGVRDPLPDLRDARRRPTSPATRSRCSCWSAASCSASCSRCSAGLLVRATARRRARTAERRLRSAISEVADELVVKPVQDVLAGYDTTRKGIDQALQ